MINRIKFQSQEHIDELNLGWDSFKWRNHQADIGRFFNVDPLLNSMPITALMLFPRIRLSLLEKLEGLEKVVVATAEFIAHEQGRTIYTGGGSDKRVDKHVYNKNFSDAPDGGEYKEFKAQVGDI